MLTNAPTLAGFDLSECLWEGSRCATWRARRRQDDRPVLLKVPNGAHPTARVTEGLRRAYELTRSGPACAVTALELIPYRRSLALVLEDDGGSSLDRRLGKERPALLESCRWGCQMAEALAELHDSGIVHKDIKPGNVILLPDAAGVKLTDFDIASRLVREDSLSASPDRLEGTLAYMAPEQTGRMNRSVDSRSDLYGLGATLYELLTGQPPFVSSDPMELIAAHLSRSPLSPDQLAPEVPGVLARLVLKLLQKDPEERYQSAVGVAADLRRIAGELERTGKCPEFRLAELDMAAHFRVPQRLYGRDEAVQALQAAFARACLGQSGQGLFVGGPSGIGKSALVFELKRPVGATQGRFALGKFDQFERSIPYSALSQAFDDLARQLLAESEPVLARWRSLLNEAIAPHGAVLIEMVPALESLLGAQPPIAQLRGEEQEQRFYQVIRAFLGALARPDHPLVLFLDDLQWADGPSLKLLDSLRHDTCGHLLFVGAFRSNEVDAGHPLRPLLREQIRLELENLSEEDVRALCADALRSPAETVSPLSRLVHQKTAGNPFFVTQFLVTLARQGLLVPDRSSRSWTWELERIGAQQITENVVELMASRIGELPVESADLLRLAACLGSSFDHRTLVQVSGHPAEQVVLQLESALREELILPVRDQEHLGYVFLHDRVQQAAYGGLSPDQLISAHARIGRILWENSGDDLEERLFEVVAHLNHGRSLLEDNERRRLLEINLRAARKARLGNAYAAARELLDVALELAGDSLWENDGVAAFELNLERCEVASLLNEYALMEELAELLIGRAGEPLQRVRVMEVRLYSYINRIQWERVLELGFAALAILGEELVEFPVQEDVVGSLMALEGRLAAFDYAALAGLPAAQAPEVLAKMRILKAITSAAYFSRPNVYPILVFRIIDLSLTHGNSAETAAGYVGYAVVQAACSVSSPGLTIWGGWRWSWSSASRPGT